jgi:uncharacterized membrane protein YdjX (TVP38/TMEM64 family)
MKLDRAQWRGVAFILLLIGVAILSATVLKEPIEKAAVWLRKEGIPGYLIWASLGYVFMMIGGSSAMFDVVCGFVFGLRGGESRDALSPRSR